MSPGASAPRPSKPPRPSKEGVKDVTRQSGASAERRISFPLPKRLIVIGDLNGDDDGLAALLRGTGVIDAAGDFVGEGVHLVQMGDVVNRGSGCRAALVRLQKLSTQAGAKNGRVTMMLGNHEAMVTLDNLAWCHPEEFLEFATTEERAQFDVARTRRVYELLEMRSHQGHTQPITGALRAWEEAHVPGRAAYREAFGADGDLGQFIRQLPVAIRVGKILFVHGGLSPRFAEQGLKNLDERVRKDWAKTPRTAYDLDPDSPLAAEDGPLWSRRYAAQPEAEIDDDLQATLASTRTSIMVVGHTRTDLIGGERGVPLVKHSDRLLCTDVGLGSSAGSAAAVVVEKNVVWAWRVGEKKRRLCALPGSGSGSGSK